MPATINVLNRAVSLETAPKFAAFTGVRLWYDDDQYFFAGDETGRVLEADNPWATQAMAEDILTSISGYAYQPFDAGSALLDPAAELGDGVNVGGVYGPLAAITTRFDAMCTADISAPADGEIEHEYPYLSPAQREYQRNKARTYSLISKTAEEIRSEVHSLQVNTQLALEELEKELGGLTGDFAQTLEQYSTITQTDSKISTAVSTSKSYTDTKTGEVVASLKNYSTITQTDSKISTAVSSSKEYADTRLKEYSTITQTANAISLAVTGLQNESQVRSLIQQRMDSIELSVSSANGSTTLKLTDGGAELSAQTLELSVNAARINGKLTAAQLNITGAITFNDLDAATQSKINNAGGSVPSYIKSTYIDEVTVMSPTIVGGKIMAASNSQYYAQMMSESFSLMGVGEDTPRAEIRADVNLVEMVLGVGSDDFGENGRLYVRKGIGSINGSSVQNFGLVQFRNADGDDAGLAMADDGSVNLFSAPGGRFHLSGSYCSVYTDDNGIVFDAGPVIVRLDNNNQSVNFFFKYDYDMNEVNKTWFLDSRGLHT